MLHYKFEFFIEFSYVIVFLKYVDG